MPTREAGIMNENDNKNFLTPKVPRSAGLATSTVDRTRAQRRREFTDSSSQLESSLGILSLKNVDLSNIVDVNMEAEESVGKVLKQQRQLANNTLHRASRVSAIPSQLLRPDLQQSKSEICNIHSESTVSESDLLQTPKNTSTPRNSSSEINLLNPPARESIMARFRDMLETDISTDNAFREFEQMRQASKHTNDSALDSALFIPAEEAASKLLADELSWKRKNDLPEPQNLTSFQEEKDLPKMSIGEFFQQGSDNLSELRAKSPTHSKPVPLIDSSIASNVSKNLSWSKDESSCQASRSLSISAIQQLLAEAEDTPTKVIDYLLKQNRKTSSRKSSSNRASSDIYSLPVSQDTSYTTSFSDNEAVRVAVRNEDKENIKPSTNSRNPIDTNDIQHKPTVSPSSDQKSLSPSPSRSSSSLTSLPNGKLPIESTVSELVWGCVKVDRCVTKQFMLRNKTPKTLRIQCSVSSYEFKIRKDNRSDSDHLTACKFVLHGHESRPLFVSFIPTKIGSAVDELVFSPLDSHLTQTKKQCVRLWGYGGYSNTEYQNATRDNTGKYWLSLGRMDNRVLMEQSFAIKNVGNLPSFTNIKVVPKNMLTFTNVKIDPNLFVLIPGEERNVKVTYLPNAKDCRIIKQNTVSPVTDIGKLEIVSGPEVNRARLRRLCRKSIEKGLAVDDLTKTLSEKIPGEVLPSDIGRFKEFPNAIPEILETLKTEEMIITIEQDPNQTLVEEYLEDSVTFQSLCQTVVVLDESVLPHKSCRLEPPLIVLFPPAKSEDRLFLTSDSPKTLYYEVKSNPKGLSISPTDGAIAKGETAEFKIKLPKDQTGTNFKIQVYVENEVFESDVKVLIAGSSRRNFLG